MTPTPHLSIAWSLRRLVASFASRAFAPSCLCAFLFLLPGCIQRTLTVTSDPPGALVYLNGEEIGRTPITHNFTWYGNYDLTLRKEGYETFKTEAKVFAPWWQIVPLDFFTSMLPVTDKHALAYQLIPASTQPIDPRQLLDRARELENQLPETTP